jgi:hypothetical protein
MSLKNTFDKNRTLKGKSYECNQIPYHTDPHRRILTVLTVKICQNSFAVIAFAIKFFAIPNTGSPLAFRAIISPPVVL